MMINEDAKMAVVRPTPDNMTHLSDYLPSRAAFVKNFVNQFFPECEKRTVGFSHKTASRDVAAGRIVQKMLEAK